VTILTAEMDVLERVLQDTVEYEASWLETQHALLRRAIVLLHSGSDGAPDDPLFVQVERTLHLVTAAMRERLAHLDATVAELRLE
jgi:hypothetical protein